MQSYDIVYDGYKVNEFPNPPSVAQIDSKADYRPLPGAAPWHEPYANPYQSHNVEANPTFPFWFGNQRQFQDYPNNVTDNNHASEWSNQAKLNSLMQV